MKKYCVAFYSNFDGSMVMDFVYADSQVSAGKAFLENTEDHAPEYLANIHTYEELQNYAFDQDHAIGVIAIVDNQYATAEFIPSETRVQ
jgi:hypothetical protein